MKQKLLYSIECLEQFLQYEALCKSWQSIAGALQFSGISPSDPQPTLSSLNCVFPLHGDRPRSPMLGPCTRGRAGERNPSNSVGADINMGVSSYCGNLHNARPGAAKYSSDQRLSMNQGGAERLIIIARTGNTRRLGRVLSSRTSIRVYEMSLSCRLTYDYVQ